MFDEIKKENEDLNKKLRILEKENGILTSKPSVCDDVCGTSDPSGLNIDKIENDSPLQLGKDGGKDTSIGMDDDSYDDKKDILKITLL